jgi:hypothetical protein
MSFEMAYNLIAEWARPYKGVGSKNSYSLGVSDELSRMARKEKAAEEVQAKEAERDGIAAKVKQEEAKRQAQLGRLAPFPETLNKLSSPKPATSADASGGINGGRPLSHDDACNMMWLDSEGIENDGFDGAPGSPDEKADESSEDRIEPDFKVEDEYSVNSFGDLDEEISKLIKPEPLSSKASFGLYSTPPPAPRIQKHSLSTAETRSNTGLSSRVGAKVEQATRIRARAGVEMGLAHATRHLSRNSHQDCR